MRTGGYITLIKVRGGRHGRPDFTGSYFRSEGSGHCRGDFAAAFKLPIMQGGEHNAGASGS